MDTHKGFDAKETLEWMRAHFDVLPEQGVLIWTKPPKQHPRLLGTSAGSFRRNHSEKSYAYVKRQTVAIQRSYLIFLWVNGRWPEPQIDHIDGNSLNDSITNLREVTPTHNAWNHKRRKRRIQLPMGVRSMNDRYQARIAYLGRMLHLGTFATPEEARAAYLEKRREMYGEYA